MRRPRSIEARLGLGIGLLLSLLWIAAATTTALILRHEVNEVFDSALQETAERLLRSSSGSSAGFSADDLFDPRTNIRLGAQYFSDLVRQFSGRISAAIGSYNAGPHVVVRWAPESSRDDDEWVEEIPYEETRAYVKSVLRRYYAYERDSQLGGGERRRGPARNLAQ